MRPSLQCWIKVMRMSVLALSQLGREGIQSFTNKYNVCCSIFINLLLIGLKTVLFQVCWGFFIFIMNKCWILSDLFLLHLLRWYLFSPVFNGYLSIDFQLLKQPCIPGMNPSWSWCVPVFIYCWIWYATVWFRNFTTVFRREIDEG